MGARQDLETLARSALDRQEEAAAIPSLSEWIAKNPKDSGLAHWLSLLLRALDRRDEAIAVLEQACKHSPDSPSLCHVLAQISLEAGLPASALFEAALELAPLNSDVRIGLVSARFAEGEGLQAADDLAELLANNPAWLAGHRTYAQLAAMLGQPQRALETILAAQRTNPTLAALHQLAIDLLLDAEAFSEALAASQAALARFGELPSLALARAAALDELGERFAAKQAFAKLGPASHPGHFVRRLRHLLRTGELAAACAELEPALAGPSDPTLWPLAALAWRANDDPRAEWLEAQEGLVSVIDLEDSDTGLPRLLPLLRQFHARSGRFYDQSVRHGTQTDGALFARIEPEIKHFRKSMITAIQRHLTALPPLDQGHPALDGRRDKEPRFAGSWSVRLTEAGHHSSHYHPQGAISSAFYAAVPSSLRGDEGKLALGESPPELGLGLPALHLIEPKPGRLVLFPSFMWHATRPFGAGERISVAFDVGRA